MILYIMARTRMARSNKNSKKANKSRKKVRRNRRRRGGGLDETPGDQLNKAYMARMLDPSPQMPSA
jgi:hypothetical protein